MKILVVGLGLIGGSIVKALSKKGYDVYGYDMNDKVLETCEKRGLIRRDYKLEDMDLVFVCLYPKDSVDYIKRHENEFKSGAILTDVAGLKVSVMRAIKHLRPDLAFIGGHPMAGKEGQGFKASDPEIFRGANYLLTPHQATEDQVNKLKVIIKDLACGQISVIEEKRHDDVIAYTSHLPHILSAAFMNCDRFEETKACIAGSFKDMTRVSDINASLWTELLLDNRRPVLKEIAVFKDQLNQLESALIRKNDLEVSEFLKEAGNKKRRL